MSGVKQYDRTDLLDKAMDLFHRQGYHGTSTAELVAELGVNRKSMYAEFGSKQELFEAALDHYNATSLSAVLAAVESSGAGLDAIRTTFGGFVRASEDWAQGRGCLLCNTALERATLAESTGAHVDAYFERLDRAFANAIDGAIAAGEIERTTSTAEVASFLTMSLLGIATMAKGRSSPERIHAANRVAMSVLDAQMRSK